MALLKSCCCCCKSIRTGSFASGIFTLIQLAHFVAFMLNLLVTYYSVIVIALAFNITTAVNANLLVCWSVVIAFGVFSVASSILMLTGLLMNRKWMLLPYVVTVSVTASVSLIISTYMLIADQGEESFEGVVLFSIIDFIMICLNIYCVLCVISQYQEYKEGRGIGREVLNLQVKTAVGIQTGQELIRPVPTLSIEKNRNGTTLRVHTARMGPIQQDPGELRPHHIELSSISEEPSSHEHGAKISTDDTSLDDESTRSMDRRKMAASPISMANPSTDRETATSDTRTGEKDDDTTGDDKTTAETLPFLSNVV